MIDSPSLQHEPVALPSRSFLRIAGSVLGYALLVGLMIVTPLSVFVPAALFACGFRNGRMSTVIALALGGGLALLLTIAVVTLSPDVARNDVMMQYAFVMAFIASVGVPSIIVLPLVERGDQVARVLLIALITSMLGLISTETTMRTEHNFSPYQQVIVLGQQRAAQILETYQKANIPSDTLGVLRRWIDFGMGCVPAFILIEITTVFVLSLVMYGRLKSWREHVSRRMNHDTTQPVAPLFLFRNFQLPDWLLFAFIIGGLTPLASGMLQKVAANVLAVVTFLYFLQGLAIFRSMLVAVGAGFVGVMFSYFLLVILTITGIAPFLLSIAGLFDSFFDFRHVRRKDHSDESHHH